MSGAWRISDQEAVAMLRDARQVARQSRTEDAWVVVQTLAERCRHLGIPEDDWLV
jgi:hypothetical protein